jgi:hypothetical protein
VIQRDVWNTRSFARAVERQCATPVPTNTAVSQTKRPPQAKEIAPLEGPVGMGGDTVMTLLLVAAVVILAILFVTWLVRR